MQPPTDHAGKILTKNQHLLQWVAETARLTKPDRVVWCDGSDEEKHRLTEEAVATGIIIPLKPAKASRLLSASLEPQRRSACRAADVHLHTHARGGRAHQQLDGPGRKRIASSERSSMARCGVARCTSSRT